MKNKPVAPNVVIEPTHAPTPFEVTDWNGQPAIKCQRGLVALMSAGYGQTRTDDAAFIVQCVNSHEELLNALDNAFEDLNFDGTFTAKEILKTVEVVRTAMRQAIAKAEAQ